MGINLKQHIKAQFFERWITVGKMKAILKNLDDDMELLPNRVGNLVVAKVGTGNLGYIDFNEEVYTKFEPTKQKHKP